jgi:hypothetical protein
VHILLRKLAFLGKLLRSTRDDLSSHVFRTLASDNIYRISLVEFLESEFRTSLTEQCLNDPDGSAIILADAKDALVKRDWSLVLELASHHNSLKHASDPNIASLKVWDFVLDHGSILQSALHQLIQ